jgi:hypothetical protein
VQNVFNFIAIARAMRLLKAGIADQNLTDVTDAAVQLGTLFGFGEETEQLAKVIMAKTFAEGVQAAGEFLLLIAAHLATGIPNLKAVGPQTDDLDACIDGVESLQESAATAISPANITIKNGVESSDFPLPDTKGVPLPLILAILQLARLLFKR